MINKGFELSDKHLDTNIQAALADTVGKSMAQIAAFFGSESARRALELSIKIDQEGRPSIASHKGNGFDVDIYGGGMDLGGSMMLP